MNSFKLSGKFHEEIFEWASRFSEERINSKCILRLYANNGKIIGIAQQMHNSIGGINTYASMLATKGLEICRRDYGFAAGDEFLWMNFYAKENWLQWHDHYELVHLDWNGVSFSNPNFETKTFDEVKEIIGTDPPKSKLKDNSYHFTDQERKELFESLSRALKSNRVPARHGGYLELEALEYTLFRQDREGQFVFGHRDANSLVLLTSDGRINFSDDEYHHRNY